MGRIEQSPLPAPGTITDVELADGAVTQPKASEPGVADYPTGTGGRVPRLWLITAVLSVVNLVLAPNRPMTLSALVLLGLAIVALLRWHRRGAPSARTARQPLSPQPPAE